MIMWTWLKRCLFTEKKNGLRYFIGGLSLYEKDERDLEYRALGGIFGFNTYRPRQQSLDIPTLSVKDQMTLNTCTFNAYAVCREPDEQTRLSPRSIVIYAKQRGLLTGNGFSTLRNTQKVGVDFGVAEEAILPNTVTDWATYSAAPLSPPTIENAAIHRSKAYFKVQTRDEWLKALDDGHLIETGTDWYSGYNLAGGLRDPWVLPWRHGIKIGGHAFVGRGYDMGRGLLKMQNSFGMDWGDAGCFYVDMKTWFGEGIAGYVAVDLDKSQETALLENYEGKWVKGASSPVIYLIQNGHKRPFPDEITFYAYGGRFGDKKTYLDIAGVILEKFPTGDRVLIQDAPVWPVLQANWEVIRWLKQPDNFKKIDELISK